MWEIARRSTIATAAYVGLTICLWILYFLDHWVKFSSSPALGPVLLLVIILPSFLFAWAVTGSLLLTPFVGGALFVLVYTLSVVGRFALVRIYGGPIPDTPGDEISQLFRACFEALRSLVTYAPMLGLLLGTAVYFMRYRLGRIVVPIAILVLAGWFLGPLLMPIIMPKLQFAVFQTTGIRPADHPPIPGVMATPTPAEEAAIALGQQFMAAQYNPELGLYRESPNNAPNRYWVYTDSYLAGADVSRWNVPPPQMWTVLVENAVVEEIAFEYDHPARDLREGVSTKTNNPGRRLRDWRQYADRVLLAAINARNAGDEWRFGELMAIANKMWDGKGLRDKAYRSRYATYKTALYYYLTGDAGARDILLSLQDRNPDSNVYGGFYVEYRSDLRPFSDTDANTETSAIVLRALIEHPAAP